MCTKTERILVNSKAAHPGGLAVWREHRSPGYASFALGYPNRGGTLGAEADIPAARVWAAAPEIPYE